MIPVTVASAVELYHVFNSMSEQLEILIPVGIGCMIYLGMYYVLIRRKWGDFFEVLEHELIHMVFAVLFFKSIGQFYASARTGRITYRSRSNFLITLSPYFFPLAPAILLCLRPFLQINILYSYDVILGFFFAFHYLAQIHHLSFSQPDMNQYSRFFSVVVISTGNFVMLGLFFMVYFNGYSGAWEYLSAMWNTVRTMVGPLLHMLVNHTQSSL